MIHLRKLLARTLAISLVGFALQVQAIPINGTISFTGTASATASGGTTTIDFSNPADVLVGTGDYSTVPTGTDVSFQDIKYTGTGDAAQLTGPVTPLWTFALGLVTYSFNLTGLDSATAFTTLLNGALVNGTGIAYISDFDPTFGTFELVGGAAGNSFTFAATTAVPEGGATVALLGFGLAGVVSLKRLSERKAS